MGYYTQIMIEVKERYGHILKERGLVMRGERNDGSLNLIFKSKDSGNWRLPVELHVPGKSETGKERAEWEDVELTADIHTEVKFGDTGWLGFIPRQSEQLQYLEGDDMAEFLAEIGLYLKECVLVPRGNIEKQVSQETAMAYEEFSDLCGPDGPEIAFSTDGKVQTLTVEDAAGHEVSFVWIEKGVLGQVFVDGKLVERLNRPEIWHIQDAIGQHFTSRADLKFR
ncbi:MAG: hypothetical protein QHC90_02665 [Shinella sp.]|nr:hypothetical protein [Shinella sp.]